MRLWRIHQLMFGLFLAVLARLAGAVISGGNVIEGALRGYTSEGAPSNGTSEVQTLTKGGTWSAGTFKLAFRGFTTAAIAYNASAATIVAALEALPTIGAGGVTATGGPINTTAVVLTFAANLGKRTQPLITLALNSVTGTSPTLDIAETTPGVDATAIGAAKGAELTDLTNAIAYINTGTPAAPTWTKVGTQT